MPNGDLNLVRLMAEQRRQAQLEVELARLQMDYERTKSPSLSRLLQIRASEAKALYLPDAPGVFAPPMIEKYCQGILLGTTRIEGPNKISCDARIHLPLQSFLGATLVLGRPGCGKTRLALNLFTQLISQDKTHVWLFDVEGSAMSVLDTIDRNDVVVLNCGKDWRFPLLAPVQGASIDENADDLFRAISSVTWMASLSATELLPELASHMERVQCGEHLDLRHVISAIRTHRNSQIKERVLGKLSLLDTEFFRGTTELDLDLLTKTNVVFNLSNLSSTCAQIFFESLSAKTLRYKQVVQEQFKTAVEQEKLIIAADEAQTLFGAGQGQTSRDDNLLPTTTLATRGRKHSVGLLLALQRPEALENTGLMSLARTLISGPLHSEADVKLLRMSLGLLPSQLDWFKAMPTQAFAVRHDGDLFPMKALDLNLGTSVWDEARINQFNQHVLKARPALARLFNAQAKPSSTPIAQKDDYFKFIEAVNDHPCHSVTHYYELLKEHFQLQKANQIRKKLEEDELIRVHNIRTGHRHVLGIEPTDKGLERYGFRGNLVFSRGADFEHTFLVENLKRHFEKQEKQVKKEKQLGSHFCDLYVEPDLAVEAAIGNKVTLEVQGIEADLQHAQTVLVVGNSKDHLQKIREALTDDMRSRVTCKLFCEVLKYG